MSRAGLQAVPGAALRYRLGGEDRGLPVVVFENGWGASFEHWAWMERELSQHTRVLGYNRAGIGGSVLERPQTVEGLSVQLAALLDALGLTAPVVVVGQSYGGLITSVHAAQIPQRLRGVVQLDPTTDTADAEVDKSLQVIHPLAKIMRTIAKLGLPDILLSPGFKTLPPEEAAALSRAAFRSADSLDAARAELSMVDSIRAVATRVSAVPRLLVSAELATEMKGVFVRMLASPETARKLIGSMQASHRETARRNGGRWMSVPHTHGGMIHTREGAAQTAAALLDFLRSVA